MRICSQAVSAVRPVTVTAAAALSMVTICPAVPGVSRRRSPPHAAQTWAASGAGVGVIVGGGDVGGGEGGVTMGGGVTTVAVGVAVTTR